MSKAQPTARAQLQESRFNVVALTDEVLQHLVDDPHDEHHPDLVPALAERLLYVRERNRSLMDRVQRLEQRLLAGSR